MLLVEPVDQPPSSPQLRPQGQLHQSPQPVLGDWSSGASVGLAEGGPGYWYEQMVMRERAIAAEDFPFLTGTFNRPPPEIEYPVNSPANYVVVPHEEKENECFICFANVVNCKIDCCDHLLCVICVKKVNFIYPMCRRVFTDFVYLKPLSPPSLQTLCVKVIKANGIQTTLPGRATTGTAKNI